MSFMQALRQEDLKYPASTLLKSSNDLGWSTLFADLRSHSRCEGPGTAAPPDAEVGIVVRGTDEGLVTCKVAGSWHPARLTTGLIWLRPIERKSGEARICSAEVEALHLYVPTVAFARLMEAAHTPARVTYCAKQEIG
jgi:AraC family transcriptional regulator